MQVTREQAAAFLDALLGWAGYGDGPALRKSPHVCTHLRAVFGFTFLPNVSSIHEIARGDGKFLWSEEKARFLQLADYLAAVADVIRREVQGDE